MRLSSAHSFSCDWRRRSLWEHKCCRFAGLCSVLPLCDATHRQSLMSGRTRKCTVPRAKPLNLSIFAVSVQHVPRWSSCFFFLSLTNLICFRLKPSDYLLRQLASQPKMKCGEKDCSWGDRSEAIMTNEDVRFFFFYPLSLSWRLSSLWLHLLECVRWREDGGHEKVNGREIAAVQKWKGKRWKLSPSPPKKNPLRCILVTILHDQWVEKKTKRYLPWVPKETQRNRWIWPTSASRCVSTCM